MIGFAEATVYRPDGIDDRPDRHIGQIGRVKEELDAAEAMGWIVVGGTPTEPIRASGSVITATIPRPEPRSTLQSALI